jgi:uncharacterized membrane protein
VRIARALPKASRLRVLFVGASALWAVLLVVTPWIASRAHASSWAAALIVGVYAVGSLICHQLPERSIHLWSVQMPVCARCAGIYFGAVAGAFASAGFRRAWPARIVLAVAAAPTALTLAYEWTTGDMPSHAIRAAAGAVIGVAVAWLIVAAAENQVN